MASVLPLYRKTTSGKCQNGVDTPIWLRKLTSPHLGPNDEVGPY